MTTQQINEMRLVDAQTAFARCCGASRWVAGMMAMRPFRDAISLHAAADAVWATMDRADILDAFSHHPQIGANLESLRKKFAATATWSAGEQAGMNAADEATLQRLADGNKEFLTRFGYIFIVCASGKSAAEMLTILESRLPNDPETELKIAAAEQAKIMHIRLDKLLDVQSNS